MWRQANSHGALACLCVGTLLCIARLILQLVFGTKHTTTVGSSSHRVLDTFLSAFVHSNFLHYAVFIFCMCAMTLIVVSLMCKEEANSTRSIPSDQLVCSWNCSIMKAVMNLFRRTKRYETISREEHNNENGDNGCGENETKEYGGNGGGGNTSQVNINNNKPVEWKMHFIFIIGANCALVLSVVAVHISFF